LISYILFFLFRLSISWSEAFPSLHPLCLIFTLCRLDSSELCSVIPTFGVTSVHFIFNGSMDQNQGLLSAKENLSELTCLVERLLHLSLYTIWFRTFCFVASFSNLYTLRWNWSLLFASCLVVIFMAEVRFTGQ